MRRVTLLRIFLLLLVLSSGLCMNAAVTYALKVGGKPVTSDNASNITGGNITSGYCTYDPSSSTLTFYDATINMVSSSSPAVESDMSKLTIVFEGFTNRILCNASPGFKLTGTDSNIRFYGNNKSKVAFSMSSSSSTYTAISVASGNLTIEQMEMTFDDPNSKNIAFYGNGNTKVAIQESQITILAGNPSYAPFHGFQDITLRSCYASNATPKNGYFYKQDNTVLKGENLFILPTLAIGRYKLNTEVSRYYTSSLIPAISQGRLGYSAPYKTLTLYDAIINSDQGYDGIRANIEGLVIKVSGKSGISTNTNNYAIRANQSMTIAGESASESSLGVLANKGIFMLGKSLSVENATLAVVSGEDPIRGYWGSSTLNITNSMVSAYTNEGNKAIYDFKECQMTDCYVTEPEGAYFSSSSKAFVTSSGGTLNSITINTPTEFYPVYILGQQLNNLNKDNFTCDGCSGTVKYDPDTRTLSLSDAVINSSTSYGIYFKDADDYQIETEGYNQISALTFAVQSTGNITFKGTGSLKASSTSYAGMLTFGDITLEANAKLTFEGKTAGISIPDNKNLYVNYVGSSTDYYLKGGNLTYFGGPIVFQNMDFCSHPDYGTPGCYYDSKSHLICQNGGTVVKDYTPINFYHVSVKYGVLVGGTAVTNANRQGVGSPFITQGGGTAVSFNSTSNTLTLDGAVINMDETSRYSYSLIESDRNKLTIEVKSDSRLECLSTSSAKENFLLNAPTTITGPGKLTISTGDVRSSISPYDNLTIKDAKIETSGGIFCSGSEKTLTVSNSYVKVNNGGIGGFSTLNLTDGTKITEPAGGYYNGWYVINASDKIAQTVILSDGKTLTGDVNGDGYVNISDIVAVINTIAGDTKYKSTADVDGDTKINITDVVKIINIIAGN